MEQAFPMIEQSVEIIAAVQTGVLFAASIVILIYYSQSRNMRHIALVALSYMMLTTLVASAVIFRVFYGGTPRFISVVFALTAFGLGDYAIWSVWANRRVVQELKDLQHLDDLAHKNESRLDTVEAELKIFRETPIEVTLVDNPEINTDK